MPSFVDYTPAPAAPAGSAPSTGPVAIPGAPQYPDPFQLAKLIPSIQGAMPGIMDVAGGINRFQSGQLMSQFGNLFPTLQPSLNQAGQNIRSKLSGIVPLDVQRQLQSNTAARALTQGVPGSQFAGNEFGQALGLTSLDMQNQGLQDLMGLTSNLRQNLTVNPYDIGQNVPNVTDLYNSYSSQAVANAAEQRRQSDLTLMREFYDKLSRSGRAGGVGGGGWGGGGSVNPGMPNLGGGSRSTPWQEPAPYTGPISGTRAPDVPGSYGVPMPSPGTSWPGANPNWADTAVYGNPTAPFGGFSDYNNYGGGGGGAPDLSGLNALPEPFGPITPDWTLGPSGGGPGDFGNFDYSDFGNFDSGFDGGFDGGFDYGG